MTETRFAIFTERQVGIGSAAAALEPHLRGQPNVSWTDVTYAKPGGLIERARLPGRAGGTLRGYLQTNEGLARGPFDAQLFLTHNPAVLHPWAVHRTPTLLWTDVTPALLDAQAEQYGHSVDGAPLLRAGKRWLVTRTFRTAARCIGWSSWAKQSFIRDYGVPEERTAVVPPGVDLTHFEFAKRPSGPPRLLFVGGDFERKGGALLLDVFRQHFRGRCALDLVTRDPVPEEEGVSVHRGLTPKSPRLLELYAGARALVLPTLGDCFSIAAIEAMAMGLPVIITRVGGIPDIVESGTSGFLIEPGDGRALRDAMAALCESDSRALEMGRRGRDIAEERYDARRTASRLLQLLADAAGAH